MVWEESLLPTWRGNNVVWWRLVGNWVCWNTRLLVWCEVLVEGGGRVIPPLAVPSPCNRVVMVLGTGASFVEGFVAVAETSVSAGTRSGGSCGTNCWGLCPPTQVC